MDVASRYSSRDASRRGSSVTPKTRIDLKVVIMGHGGVGKTSFINRYIHNNFAETVSTIGASFVLKKWRKFFLGIWDTAGQERFTKISSYYCRSAQAAILAYDLSDRESFHALENYSRFLSDADPDCMIVVIGTKADLLEEDPTLRKVSIEEGEQYARQLRAAFFETSAKDNLNVTAVFDRICFQCFASKLSNEEIAPPVTIGNDPSRSTAIATRQSLGALTTQKTCCSLQ